ncbi:DEAD/DEAH box helicase [Desertibacillus haloalkaliphilus]|uniref:DEAD/DEAH box helicase n=1 Tax=Desertibacillus haloalkaliphilus TaxID=1328930 RepID=UPI001C2696B1|nr:DEAD/DEAH box helicase [Desertibacillus haloalkaliphilus]MBU8905688.1 DEAD/DEAH box helicase [Desertibacillus haloalkaliphilus]
MEKSQFKRLELQPFLLEALHAQGFKKPTEIQERLVPAISNGKDVIGQSETGSGKTLAFLLPIVNNIDPMNLEVQAVITAPTRELATQIHNELKKLLDYCDPEQMIQAKLMVGGTDRLRSMEKLKMQPHIVVGTPGRIHDMVTEQALKIYTTATLVVDEADQMLDMGFIADVDKIAARMSEELQMLVFSATIPEKLQPFLKKYMNNPRHVHVKPKQVTTPNIDHRLMPLRHRDKLQLVTDIATALNPFLAIIFTNTKEAADEVADTLAAQGLNVDRLHGGLHPRQRKQVMKRVKDLKTQFLVATDLAARGIDIKGVSHIINYELPKDLDFYVHRVGRTGRAGDTGVAVTLYEQTDQFAIDKLKKRGISFTYVDLRRGDWVTLEKPKERIEKRKLTKADISPKTGGKAKAKGKAVKPGYKKKQRWQQEQEEKRQRKLARRKQGRNKR